MIKSRKEIELMAPAGSYEALAAAIKAGADSIYFGAGNLNMRSKSSYNFGVEDLRRTAEICQESGVKSYLTLNTVIYNKDLEQMKELVDAAAESGISAIIASDMAVINYVNQRGIELHLSTQCNVSNIEAVRWYAQFADVVVLARELSLDQVTAITQAIEKEKITGPSGELVKIEIFCHGALCMAVSGKCYISLHDNNHSANRGACHQNCRRSYIVRDKESGQELEIDNERIMSPKDLNTIAFVDRILDAGVRVLKVEGRGRPPEYVKRVCTVYNEAIDAYLSNSYTVARIDKWNKQLSTVFNREFWDGYYLGQRTGEWSDRYGSQASKKKVYIGHVTNYYSKIGVGEFKIMNNELSVGEEILISGSTTGAYETTVEEIRLDEEKVQKVEKGDLVSIAVSETIRRNDKLYKYVPVDTIKLK
jgi:U32 family peptidase